ncbi:hypothetical protein [Streptomyces sp. LS1784]|uniref:hypothetical protein n=1 Tax=Streptomyces sp. LS1784 TaxID=2851533 RepID=UPI001CC9B6C5|nr:hypothetical protein [Streptomyces sp. LS1784]
MKTPAALPRITPRLPVLAPPVRRDGQAEAGRLPGDPGVAPARSVCADLTGAARGMCYAAL